MATRVVASASGLLAILLFVVVLTHNETRDQRREDEVAHARDFAAAASGMVDGFARDLEATVLSVAVILGGESEITQEFAGPKLGALTAEYEGLLRTIFVTDPQGRVVAASPDEGLGTDLAARPYMQVLMSGERTAWSSGLPGLASGEILVTYGHRMDAPDGSLKGFVVAAFYPRTFMARLSHFVPDDSAITVVDEAGLPLYTTEVDDAGLPDAGPVQTSELAAAMAGEVVSLDGSPGFFTEEERFGAIVPVDRTRWAVAFTRPLAPLEASLREELLTQVGIVAAAVVGVAALFTLITHHITRPLDALAGAARAVAQGARPSIPTDGESEVRVLATAMESMVEAVSDREDTLRLEAERRAILAEASRAFSEASRDLDQALSVVASSVCEAVGDGCAILLRRGDGHLVSATMHHRDPEAQAFVRTLIPSAIPEDGPGITSQVVRSGAPVLAERVTAEEFRALVSPAFAPYVERYGAHSLSGHPLRVRGALTGTLVVWRDMTSEAYTTDDQALLQDISDRAALAIENARLFNEVSEQVVAVDRAMQAHLESVALVSHDLKNPLATIKATAQWVRRGAQRDQPLGPDQLQRAMESIEQATSRAVDEVEAMLDDATLQAGGSVALTRSTADLVPYLRAMCEEFQQRSPSHRIEVEAGADAVLGEWDTRRLERAMANLLENALKYSPDGGLIRVTLGLEEHEDGAEAVLTISDQGVGIPRTALSRVFDRFYRAENVAEHIQGNGLGLTGVRYVVEAHGGTIEARSELGEGSTFIVRLPCRPPEADRA